MRRIYLAFFLLIFPIFSYADPIGYINGNGVNVYEQPSSSSDILTTLNDGVQVLPLDKRGEWIKIRVEIQPRFKFSGWISARSLRFKKVGNVLPPPVVLPPPAAVQHAPQPVRQSTPQRKVEERESSEKSAWGGINDRLTLQAGTGVLFYNYSLTSGSTQIFSYSLPGYAIDIDAQYWAWVHPQNRLRAGANLFFQRGFISNSTKLKNTSGVVFQTVNSDATLDDFKFTIPFEYRLGSKENSGGLQIAPGFEYYHFAISDVVRDLGSIGLYTSQTTTSIVMNVLGSFWISSKFPVRLNLGIDLLLGNSVSESPANTTGTNPNSGLMFVPRLEATTFFTKNHHLNVGYQLRMQTISFQGTGSRVDDVNVTDGRIKTTTHNLGVRYEYTF